MRMLAGVACAALITLAAPVTAATSPELRAQSISNASADQAVSAFYAARNGAPFWLRSGADSSAARELIGVLERAPRRDTPGQILARAAAAPSLTAYVRSVSAVNPLYAQLRDAAWSQMQSNGGQVDPRVLASLDRVRDMPVQNRYVMVDTGGARLYMIEDGRIAGSMKVIVGKADPSTQTPMLASTIYYATLNPYWHV